MSVDAMLFSIVTLFIYPKGSGHYVQVQGPNQMPRPQCETQLFLLSDNKRDYLPFGRSSKWKVVGAETSLKDGEVVVSSWSNEEVDIRFLCVPTGWDNKIDKSSSKK